MSFVRYILMISLLIGQVKVCLADQNPYHFDPKYPVHDLDAYTWIIEDSTGMMSLDQLRNDTTIVYKPYSYYKNKTSSRYTLSGYSNVFWGKLTLLSSQEIKDWFLQFEEDPYFINGWMRGNGKVDVYGYLEGELLFHKKSGVDYPKREKEVKEHWNINRVRISLENEKPLTLYIRVEGNSFAFPPFFDLVLRRPDFQDYYPIYDRRHFVVKIMLGMLVISLLYHFLLFVYLKQRVYLLFNIWLFLSMMAILMSVPEGILTKYFIGNIPGLRPLLWTLFANGVWICFWFFGREYVLTYKKYPKLDKAIKWLVILMIANLCIYTTLGILDINAPSFIGFLPSMILTIAGLIFSILLFLKDDKLARYFGVGAFFASLAPLIGMFWVSGAIRLPFDPYTWGIMFQIIAYSFGLAYRRQLEDIAFKNAQAELLEAEKHKIEMQRIKDLDEVKTRFFANISHEFRTPLSLILGPMNQLEQTDNGSLSISKKSYDIVHRNALRLQHLVDQLLDLSKLESGKIDLKLVRGDILRFIKPLVSSFESIAQAKGVNYQVHLGSPSQDVYYDEDKLEKIINNLISNAFKFTPENGTVSVETEVKEGQLYLTVKDTGKGMDKASIDRIFDRFYRVEGTEEKGSGIGLALTRELVQLHNGHIHVESQKGVGTTFKISLPVLFDKLPSFNVVQDNVAVSVENGIVEMAEDQDLDPVLKNDKLPEVLIIEDNADLRAFISEQLQGEYHTIIAENGIKGEKLACESIPDIIISDVMMPGMDGFTLCRSLKNNPITSHIPIILLTAKAGQHNKMDGLDVGADAYLTKPFEIEELKVRMKNLIQSREALWNRFKKAGFTHLEEVDVTSLDDRFLQKVHEVIMRHLSDEDFNVSLLAREVGFSRSQLHRKLKAVINKSANQLIREVRLHHAHTLLQQNHASVSEIAYQVGFSNLSYFSKSFKEQYGKLPSEVYLTESESKKNRDFKPG